MEKTEKEGTKKTLKVYVVFYAKKLVDGKVPKVKSEYHSHTKFDAIIGADDHDLYAFTQRVRKKEGMDSWATGLGFSKLRWQVRFLTAFTRKIVKLEPGFIVINSLC